MQIIPYSFTAEKIDPPSFSDMEYPLVSSPALITRPGQVLCVYITLHPDAVDEIADMFERWFATRAEVQVIDCGTSDKQGLGFIALEWCECEVDQLFPEILKEMPLVADFTLYARALEG